MILIANLNCPLNIYKNDNAQLSTDTHIIHEDGIGLYVYYGIRRMPQAGFDHEQ